MLVLAALAAGLVAYLRRPVKQPETSGTWHPAERQKTHR
jgi:hypothetical protein